MRAFSQVDVFSPEPQRGNPVAVVHGAEGVSDEQMAAFARWTNLSETSFLLPPSDPGADYRLRIWTPGGELAFAGHPTLGSAHAWLEAGGVPARSDEVVQECGAGLVRIRRGDRLAFASPPLVRSGPVSDDDLATIVRALRIEPSDVVDAAWCDNGAGWVAVVLADADAVLALRPDFGAFGGLDIGAAGLHPSGSECAIEVRGFAPDMGIPEDPATGSLNAVLAQWLAGDRLPTSYVAAQGTAIGRRGRIHVSVEGEVDASVVWVGGDTRTTITGQVHL